MSVCFQSWQGPWGPPAVRPAILTPCPVWHQGLSALLLSDLPLHGGNFQVFSAMHCATFPRPLPRSECPQGAHSFYLSRCISYCNEVPQTWWRKPQTFFLKARVQNQGVGRAELSEPVGKKLPVPSSF